MNLHSRILIVPFVLALGCFGVSRTDAAVLELDFSEVVGWDLNAWEPTVPMTSTLGGNLLLTITGDPEAPVEIPLTNLGMRVYEPVTIDTPYVDDQGNLILFWLSQLLDWRSLFGVSDEDIEYNDRLLEHAPSARSSLTLKLDWEALSAVASQPEGTNGPVPLNVSYSWYEANFAGSYESWDDNYFFTPDGQVANVTVVEANPPAVPLSASWLLLASALSSMLWARRRPHTPSGRA